jgi:glycosyltransferase involved in cell wall biosynthesis
VKLAWFMPLHPGSAIGRFGRLVTTELARRGHDLAVFPSDSVPPANPAPFGVPLRDLDPRSAASLGEEFDAVLYNIGDHFPFHGGLFGAIDAAPGIGIFHDASIINLYVGWRRARGPDIADAEPAVSKYYGAEAARTLPSVLARGAPAADLLPPMTEWLAERVWGAVAHAGHYVGRLRRACPGPVATIPLAYRPAAPIAPPAAAVGRGGDLVVLTVGRMNGNKCYETVIDAIAASPVLRGRAVFRLFGAGEPSFRRHLEALARRRRVRLEFCEVLDDGALSRAFESADIVCALRRPVLEGASASAIEGLISGRPVVVADAGFYAEIPDRYVVKVPADIPVPVLAAALERLAGDPAGRHALGRAAREWALDHYSPARYCDALERHIEDFIGAKPLLRLGTDIGRRLAGLGFRQDDPAIAAIAETARHLFFGEQGLSLGEESRAASGRL